MARILVQTDDRRSTLMEERLVGPGDLVEGAVADDLLARLRDAVAAAQEPKPKRRQVRVRRLASIVPATDYRELRG